MSREDVKRMRRPIIGILTWRQGTRFQEQVYFRNLIREGHELGATVFLFSHVDANVKERKIRGFVPSSKGGWEARWFDWPDVVIDRCRKGEPGYREFRKQKLFLYANSTYTRKWNATQLFLQEDDVKKWVPATVAYSSDGLKSMLKQYPMLYIKPGNGTGGRSIVKVTRTTTGFTVQGRDRNLGTRKTHFKTYSALLKWLDKWIKNNHIRNGIFMIQQGVNLELVADRVADTRLLIQKNEHGVWSVTGLGVRVGKVGSAVSNLHGGGKAVPFQQFIRQRFSEAKTEEILKECHEMAHQIVRTIEKHFGSMMEFGLDIGVDVNGRVWLIEVNPKPGRDIFKGMGNYKLYKKAVQRPLQYALYLVKEQRTLKENAS